tara:strand:- start:376 stop:645 length:270 start_codon:yes stop_codon:yes gene_type:complete
MKRLKECRIIDREFNHEYIPELTQYAKRYDQAFDLTDFDNFFCASVACFHRNERDIEGMIDYFIDVRSKETSRPRSSLFLLTIRTSGVA